MKDYSKKMTLDRRPRNGENDSADRRPRENQGYGDRRPRNGESDNSDRRPRENQGYGDRRPHNGDNDNNDRRPRENQGYGDRRPRNGENDSADRRPRENQSYGDRRPRNGEGDNNDRRPRENQGYGDRRPRNGENDNNDRRPRENQGYGDRRPRNGENDSADRRPPIGASEPAPQRYEDELPLLVMGRQAVKETVKSGRSINSVLVQQEPDGSLREIIGLARDRNLIIKEVKREKLDELCMPFGHGGRTGNHQGIVAMLPGIEYAETADMLALAEERGEAPFLILLDGVEDPHNLGSIIRSAECAGAHGVIIPRRRSAQVTGAVIKASAGATANMLVARVANIRAEMEKLKERGIWLCGADMAGEPMAKVNMKGALALVIGGEGAGLAEHVKRDCDMLAAVPMRGKTGSLNAGVAAAILMFEKRRQDG